LSDAAFAKVIEDLCDSREPLAERGAEALCPTQLGRRVLAEEAVWPAAPASRWIGGVALDGTTRWDSRSERFAGETAS